MFRTNDLVSYQGINVQSQKQNYIHHGVIYNNKTRSPLSTPSPQTKSNKTKALDWGNGSGKRAWYKPEFHLLDSGEKLTWSCVCICNPSTRAAETGGPWGYQASLSGLKGKPQISVREPVSR